MTQPSQTLAAVPSGVRQDKLPLKTRLRRAILLTAARSFPDFTAKMLARRYLCSSHGFLDELKQRHMRRQEFEIVQMGPDLAILRHGTAEAGAPRVLVVPGHDGHYRQFTRLVDNLARAGAVVDLLVLPGHMHVDRTVCSLRHMTEAIETALRSQGPYNGLVAHCVTANAALHVVHDGLPVPRLALISTPFDLPRLVELGGKQYGLSGCGLKRFVHHVDLLSAPYHLDMPWQSLAAQSADRIIAVHAEEDYAAPVEDVRRFKTASPSAEIAIFDKSGHNTILNNKVAMAQVTAFILPEAAQTTTCSQGPANPPSRDSATPDT